MRVKSGSTPKSALTVACERLSVACGGQSAGNRRLRILFHDRHFVGFVLCPQSSLALAALSWTIGGHDSIWIAFGSSPTGLCFWSDGLRRAAYGARFHHQHRWGQARRHFAEQDACPQQACGGRGMHLDSSNHRPATDFARTHFDADRSSDVEAWCHLEQLVAHEWPRKCAHCFCCRKAGWADDGDVCRQGKVPPLPPAEHRG